ncbi:MAG: hypothetical protein ACOYU7_03985 [Bacillota bacterium]
MLDDITNREKQLLLFIRQLGWGEVKIRVENGQPVVIYEAIRTFKLEDEKPANGNRTGNRKRVP